MLLRRTLLPVCLAIVALSGTTFAAEQATGARIQADDVWARRAPMMKGGDAKAGSGNGAVYAVLVNPGKQGDALTAATSDAAEVVEIHETYQHMGMSMMRQVRKIEVPAGKKVELKPGGYHIMLINLKRDLKAGENVNVTLQFDKAGTIPVTATIR